VLYCSSEETAAAQGRRPHLGCPLGILLCLTAQALVFYAGFEPGHSLVFDLLAGRSGGARADPALHNLIGVPRILH